jgi:peptide/nickel transport system substrate-binding protein
MTWRTTTTSRHRPDQPTPPRRLLALLGSLLGCLLVASGCSGSTSAPDEGADSTGDEGSGTLVILTSRPSLSSLDPQRVTGRLDRALLGDFVHRTLVRYAQDPDLSAQSALVPDLATDVGTPNGDYTQWSFTLRDDAQWADGAPIVCEDVRYGVSRQFARDTLVGGLGLAVELLDIPTGPDGASVYAGPYSDAGEEQFNRAVACDGQQIVFSLSEPVGTSPKP